MTTLNQTIALTHDLQVYDGINYRKFNTITELCDCYKQNKKIVIWCYSMLQLYVDVGTEFFDDVLFRTEFGETPLYVKKDNIEIKNAKEFYKSWSLQEIAKNKNIPDTDELTIIYKAIESERQLCSSISRIPKSIIGYISREINDTVYKNYCFKYLAKSISEDTHAVLAKCKSGGLSGIDDTFRDKTIIVNGYDFKSFYPWIMYTQLFPYTQYRLYKNVSINALSNAELWVATIKFKKIIRKNIDWLKIRANKEVTITNLDFKIIQRDYIYEIDSIPEFIPFTHPRKLPECLRKLILEKFKIKESYPEDSEEYQHAKLFLNCIFGLFCQNRQKYKQDIDCWSAKQRPFVIGLFTAAYGRYYLWEVMHDKNPIHWDTDGFKAQEVLDFTEFNSQRKIDGVMLGQLLEKETDAKLTVYGNKQYMLDDVLKLVGTDGQLALQYFKGKVPKCGDVIPPEYTSRHIIKNNQIIKVNYTIGKELSE